MYQVFCQRVLLWHRQGGCDTERGVSKHSSPSSPRGCSDGRGGPHGGRHQRGRTPYHLAFTLRTVCTAISLIFGKQRETERFLIPLPRSMYHLVSINALFIFSSPMMITVLCSTVDEITRFMLVLRFSKHMSCIGTSVAHHAWNQLRLNGNSKV